MSLLTSLLTNVTGVTTSSVIPSNTARRYKNIFAFGSSNIGGKQEPDSAFSNQHLTFPSGEVSKLNYSNELVDFAYPINAGATATFNLVNEQDNYGVLGGIVKAMRDAGVAVPINVCGCFESGIPVAYVTSGNGQGWFASYNENDPFDLSTRFGQVLTRAKALMDITGEPIDLIYFPDGGRESAYGAGVGSAVLVASYETMIPIFLSLLGLSSATTTCIVPNVGSVPTVTGYANWDNVRTGMRDDFTPPPNTYLIDPERDLGITLDNGVIHEYPLSVGESGTWTLGETLTGATSGVSGIIGAFNLGGNIVSTVTKANFTAGEVVTGGTSGVTGTLSSPLAPVDVHLNAMAENRMGALAASKLIAADTTQYTVAQIGDSITSQNDASNDKEFNSQGYMTWLNALTGQRYSYQPSHNLGASGQSISQTLDNITDLSALSPVPNLVFWLPFANDITGSRSYADLIIDFDAITAYITSTLGAKLVIGTTLPRTQDLGVALTTAQQTLLNQLNDYIRSVGSDKITIVDMYHAMTTAGTDDPNPDYFDDEDGKLLHPNPAGAHAMAAQYKATLDSVFGSFAIPDMSVCALGLNSDMSGTGGTENTPLTRANIADNWTLYSYSGMTGSALKTLDDKQALNLSYTDGLSYDLWEMRATDITSGFSEGEQYYMEAEAEIVSASNVRTAFCVEPTLNSSGSYKAMSPYDVNGWPDSFTGTLYLRTPVFTIGASDTNIDPILWAQMNSVGVTSNTNIIIKQARFVKV